MTTKNDPDQELTPVEIVGALDRHIVGQMEAKRAVAIAIRNRWRRKQLDANVRDEVLPKNIILIGSTGVGKTEIARRVAQLVRAPFLKVEATKYTEVGYHGRDVESMIRDLVEIAANLVRQEELAQVQQKAEQVVDDRLLDLLVPTLQGHEDAEEKQRRERTRQSFAEKLRSGALEDRQVEVDVPAATSGPPMELLGQSGSGPMGIDLQGLLGKLGGGASKKRRMKISQARPILQAQEADKLVDEEKVNQEAVARAEQSGIVFLDELDKIVSQGEARGPEVSRGGVQRDLLPIVEGSSVMTRYGIVQTDHILFIGAGAFHGCKPTDLIPELQGRFPIRVELSTLEKQDFVRILKEPEHALPRQYAALLGTEGVALEFTEEGLVRLAEIAWDLNEKTQNIGARRLYTIFEKLLEATLFEAPDLIRPEGRQIQVDRGYVDERLQGIIEDDSQSAYIL